MPRQFDDPVLVSYTKLLRTRIAHIGGVDFNFIHSYVAEQPKTYNEHLGRYVGWFEWSEDDRPAILLLARQAPEGNITHAFLIHVNLQCEDFPFALRSHIKTKLPIEPKFCICNIKTSLGAYLDFAVLMEYMYYFMSVDCFMLGERITARFEGGQFPPLEGELKNAKPCKHQVDPSNRNVLALMRANKLSLVDLDQAGDLPRYFNIIRVKIGDHNVFGINYHEEEAILILIPRINQLPGQIHFQVAKDRIDERFPGLFKVYHCVKLRIDADCTSSTVLKACILLTRLPLLNIDNSDVCLALEDLNCLSMGGSQNIGSQRTSSQSRSQRFVMNDNILGTDVAITMSSTSEARRPRIVSTDIVPEATIRSQQLVRRELGIYRAWMAVGDDNSHPYPPSIRAKRRSCPTGTILHNLEWMMEQLAIVAFTWERFTTVKLLECQVLGQLGRHHIDDKIERFVILPIQRHNADPSCGLLIFDKDSREWAFLHPENNAKDSIDLLAGVKEWLVECGPRYADWDGRIIIISSSYHKDYPYVHLIMALYYMGRLFRYAIQLPAKIVYTEQNFRLYSYHHCLAVQIVNQSFNLENGFLDDYGHLEEGALISMPSPVQFERAVVPVDICGFCKKRGFNNLGRHMSMAHGGQAIGANIERRIQYGYNSRDQ